MKKINITILILLIVFVFTLSCKNQEIFLGTSRPIKNTVDIKLLAETSIEVGDPIDIVLTINAKKDSEIIYPKDKEQFKPFFLKNYRVRKKIKSNMKITYVYYTITSFYPGEIILPSLSIQVNNRLIKTAPIKIKIKSTLSSKRQRDINDITAPLKDNRFFILIFILIVLLLFLILFYRKRLVFLRNRKKINAENKEKNITYDTILTSMLTIFTLRKEDKLSIKEKYYIISNSFKKILGAILNQNFMPLTSNKIKRILYKQLPKELHIYIIEKLNKYDEIKYSKKIFNLEFSNKLRSNFLEETNDLLKLISILIKDYYKEMINFMV